MAWGRNTDPELQFAKAATRAFASEKWGEAAAFLAAIFPEDTEHARKAVGILKLSAKEGHADYILGQLAPLQLAAHCSAGHLGWGEGLRALAGQADRKGLDDFMDAGAGNFTQQDLDHALRAAVRLRRMSDSSPYSDRSHHYSAGGKEEAAALLVEKGAKVAGDNADLLISAIEQNKPGLVKLLVENGQDLAVTGQSALKKAEYHGYNQIVFYLREKLIVNEKFAAPDAQTLVETKTLDPQGSRLRLVFNFETRRVTEIYDPPSGREGAAMTSHAFADYDPDSISDAFARLTQMGGHPKPPADHKPPSVRGLDKPMP